MCTKNDHPETAALNIQFDSVFTIQYETPRNRSQRFSGTVRVLMSYDVKKTYGDFRPALQPCVVTSRCHGNDSRSVCVRTHARLRVISTPSSHFWQTIPTDIFWGQRSWNALADKKTGETMMKECPNLSTYYLDTVIMTQNLKNYSFD